MSRTSTGIALLHALAFSVRGSIPRSRISQVRQIHPLLGYHRSTAIRPPWNGCWTSLEKKPSDPTIAQKFNTYRLPEAGCFADYKENVIDLLAGDDGERGEPGQPRAFDPGAGMEVVRGMSSAPR